MRRSGRAPVRSELASAFTRRSRSAPVPRRPHRMLATDPPRRARAADELFAQRVRILLATRMPGSDRLEIGADDRLRRVRPRHGLLSPLSRASGAQTLLERAADAGGRAHAAIERGRGRCLVAQDSFSPRPARASMTRAFGRCPPGPVRARCDENTNGSRVSEREAEEQRVNSETPAERQRARPAREEPTARLSTPRSSSGRVGYSARTVEGIESPRGARRRSTAAGRRS